jgi:hypothetical protein
VPRGLGRETSVVGELGGGGRKDGPATSRTSVYAGRVALEEFWCSRHAAAALFARVRSPGADGSVCWGSRDPAIQPGDAVIPSSSSAIHSSRQSSFASSSHDDDDDEPSSHKSMLYPRILGFRRRRPVGGSSRGAGCGEEGAELPADDGLPSEHGALGIEGTNIPRPSLLSLTQSKAPF